jgi:hypothetical protein
MTDWTTDAADVIERAVVTVRDRTVVPAQSATRAVVYGLLATCVVATAVLLLTVATFRVLVVVYQGEVWAAWLTLGGIFLLAGWFLWAKRTA